jgi:hypothetical protein
VLIVQIEQDGTENCDAPFTNSENVPSSPAKLNVTLSQAFAKSTSRFEIKPESGNTVASPLPVIVRVFDEPNVTADPSMLTTPSSVFPDCVPVE